MPVTDLERWRGQVALVTGASSGIGAACARALAGAGLRVAIAARRADRLEALQRELEHAGAQVLAVPADLRREGEIARLFATLRQAWGGAAVLVNNAGLGRNGPFAALNETELQAMLDVNLRAVALCMREALEDMEAMAQAAIVNISSVAAHRIRPGQEITFYTATKHGVRALTEAVRLELAQAGSPVRLGMISPGMVESEFYARATGSEGPYDYGLEPLAAEDIAGAMLYMLSVPPRVQVNDIILRPTGQVY